MKSKIENWIQYPTLIPYLFYLAHAFYLPRLAEFLNSTTPYQYYQWPVRIVLDCVSNQDFGKWIIVVFCILVYFLSIFYGRKKYIQFLVVITNLLYIAMNSFPVLGINANESFCFLYFSIAILFFDLNKKFFIDKYKVLIGLAVSPYVLSGLIKIYNYPTFLTDKILFNRIIELEYFSHQSSFLIPFLKGHNFPTYPLLPLAIALQVSGIFAISSLRYRKIWMPLTLLFHLFNSILFNIHFFFSFIILHFSFFNSEESLGKTEKRILTSTFYFLLIFTGQNLYKLTTLALQDQELAIFRLYSILYLIAVFAGMFLYEKYFMRLLLFIFLIFNTALFLTYNIPFSFSDYVVLIILAFTFLKDSKRPLMEIKEWLLKGITFIGGMRAGLLIILTLEKIHFFNFPLEKIPRALYLMVELPTSNRWNAIVFLLISILEIFYRKMYSKKWTLPLLIMLHLYLACFFSITSSYYLFWVILVTALSNIQNSNAPNKWTIASCEI